MHMKLRIPLSESHPKLADEWHPDKNGDLAPDRVTAGSNKKVWWKCPTGPDHEWEAAVSDRTSGKGCPCCAGRQVSTTNSLVSLHPDLAVEWHPDNNGDLSPDQVVAGSSKKVWWKCPKGPDHEWKAALVSRTGGNGCPCCAGYKVSITNSLASLHPDLATEWHPDKNGDLSPDQVTAGSHKKVWWKCAEGPDHEWESTIVNRARGSGCPCCAGYKVSITNSLASLHPDLATEWHPDKNGDLSPDQVTAGSHNKVCGNALKGQTTSGNPQ